MRQAKLPSRLYLRRRTNSSPKSIGGRIFVIFLVILLIFSSPASASAFSFPQLPSIPSINLPPLPSLPSLPSFINLKSSIINPASVLGLSSSPQPSQSPQPSTISHQPSSKPSVLSATAKAIKGTLSINIPAIFNNNLNLNKDLTVEGTSSFKGPIKIGDKELNLESLDLGSGKVTASNLVYSLTASDGISVTSGQSPAIKNTGVLSLQGKTGALTFTAGTGMSISGLTITNDDTGSSQKIFKTVTVGSTSFSAGSNTDTLTFAAGTGISITPDTTNKKLTIATSSLDSAGGWTDSGTSISLSTSTDSVGIGTSSPTKTLDVSGTFNVSGAATLGSTLGVTSATTLSSTLAVTGDTTLTGDLAVNGADLTSSATSFNLLNSTVTTLNIGGAATSLSLGALTGTTTINNALSATGTLTASNFSGTFSGTSSGTNTGDQTITLTGDVTGSGTGSFAATIGTGAVTSAKILDGTIANADIATDASIAYSKLNLSSSIVTGDILDGTITGSDLASNIAITTTGATNLNSSVNIAGATVIAPTQSGAAALTLRASSTSPGNILNLTNSAGDTSYMSVSSTGALTIGGSTLTNAGLLESGGAIHLTNSANAIVGTAIEGGWTMNSNTFTYRRTITVTNADGSNALPANYEVSASLSSTTASHIYSNSQADYDDFRIAYSSDGSTFTEVKRNVSSFTSSSVAFTFQLQAEIAASGTSSNYYIYYKNSDLTCSTCTYTGNVSLDTLDSQASNYTSSDTTQFPLADEASIVNEGTGSLKMTATVDNIGTFSTASQNALSAARTNFGFASPTISGTRYLYVVGGKSSANDSDGQTTVLRTSVNSTAGNVGSWTTNSNSISEARVDSSVAVATSPFDTGTGSDGAIDLTNGSGADGCTGSGLSWNAGTSTCTIATATKSTFNFTTVTVPVSTTLTTDGPKTTTNFVTIKATGAVTIAGTIDLAGKGYSGGGTQSSGSGPGAGGGYSLSDGGSGGGGGYGGAGGKGINNYSGGGTAGATYSTDDSGSGGGGGNCNNGTGGAGGGGIKISSGGTITASGTINTNGTNGVGGVGANGGGGGSGGRIYLQGSTLTISGTFSANGGNGGSITAGDNCAGTGGKSGGGGGGGRITLEYSDSLSTTGSTVTVSAGSRGTSVYGILGSNGSTGVNTSTASSPTLYVLGGKNTSGTAQSGISQATITASDGSIGSFSNSSVTLANASPGATSLFGHTTNVVTISSTNYMYIVGGNNGTSDQTTVYKGTFSGANISAISTTSQTQLGTGISYHAAVTGTISSNNYIWVLGGLNGSTAQTSVYRGTIDSSGNITALSTTSQGTLPQALYGHKALFVTVGSNNYIYVYGGMTTGGTRQTTVYKASVDGSGNVGTFTTVGQTQLSTAISDFGAFNFTDDSSNQYAYIVGGNTGTVQTAVLKAAYTPIDQTTYNLSRTISSTDLSNKNDIQFKVYSSRTGSNILDFGISEDGSTWQNCNITVSSANTWETKTCDISGIATTSRDAVTSLRFRVINSSTSSWTVYFDDIDGLTEASTISNSSSAASAVLGANNLNLNAQGTGLVAVNYSSGAAQAGSGGMIVYNGATTALFTVSSAGDLTAIGTTGLTLSGAGADIVFSGSGTHTISASSGTLEIGAFTATGAIAANSGITFDNTTDTLGAHTAGGTYDMNANIISNIGSTGTDFTSTGALAITLDGAESNGALYVSNSSQTSAILTLADNSTTVLQVADSGLTTINPVAAGTVLDFTLATEWTSGTLVNAGFASSTTQGAAAILGISLNLNSNLTTPAAGQNITGYDIQLPASSTTSNTTAYTGYNLSAAGAITNATAGSFAFRGVNITMPNITQSAGGSVTSSGVLLTPGTITTAGTQDLFSVAAQTNGPGAGTLNALNIGTITTPGAGTENALNIGSGWDMGILLADDLKVGLGTSAGYIEFDNQDTDEINFMNANVGIGTTTPSYQLELSTDSAAKPVSNTWTIASDRRLKDNIQGFDDGLSILKQINPVSYQLNGKAHMPAGASGIGIIAQEVKDLIPYTISTFKARLNPEDSEETELYSFNSSALTFVTINAIKELDIKLDELGKAVENQSLDTRRQASLDEQLSNINSQLSSINHQSLVINDLKDSVASLSARLAVLESTIPSAEASASSTWDDGQTDSSQVDILGLNTLLSATPSASFTSNYTLSTIDATISGTLKSLGETFLGNTTLAGNFTVDGTMGISGNSVNSLGCNSEVSDTSGTLGSAESFQNCGILYIQNSSLSKLVDMFNGKVKIDKEGKISVQKLEVSGKTLGTAIIPAGETKFTIYNLQFTNSSKVFISPDQLVTIAVTEKDPANHAFTVTVEQALTKDLTFDWWIVDSTP